jgi:hypothetical protein
MDASEVDSQASPSSPEVLEKLKFKKGKRNISYFIL